MRGRMCLWTVCPRVSPAHASFSLHRQHTTSSSSAICFNGALMWVIDCKQTIITPFTVLLAIRTSPATHDISSSVLNTTDVPFSLGPRSQPRLDAREMEIAVAIGTCHTAVVSSIATTLTHLANMINEQRKATYMSITACEWAAVLVRLFPRDAACRDAWHSSQNLEN